MEHSSRALSTKSTHSGAESVRKTIKKRISTFFFFMAFLGAKVLRLSNRPLFFFFAVIATPFALIPERTFWYLVKSNVNLERWVKCLITFLKDSICGDEERQVRRHKRMASVLSVPEKGKRSCLMNSPSLLLSSGYYVCGDQEQSTNIFILDAGLYPWLWESYSH